MKISRQQLVEIGACEIMLGIFDDQTKGSEEPVDIFLAMRRAGALFNLAWIAAKILPRDRIIKFACDCALLNIEKIKPYTDDYDAIIAFLKDSPVLGPQFPPVEFYVRWYGIDALRDSKASLALGSLQSAYEVVYPPEFKPSMYRDADDEFCRNVGLTAHMAREVQAEPVWRLLDIMFQEF